VIADGGGNGAALFSRPKPQSRGETPGGARLLSIRDQESTSKHRREPNLRRNTTTLTAVKPEVPPSGSKPVKPITHTPKPGSHKHGNGWGSATKGLGAATSGAGSSMSTDDVSATRGGAQQAGGQGVKGVLIDASSSTTGQQALDPGAPGFHSAGAGGNQTPWLAIAIAGALLLCALFGAQLERRRPEAIL